MRFAGRDRPATTARTTTAEGSSGDPQYRRSPHLLLEWHGGELSLLNCDSMLRVAADPRVLEVLGRLDGWHSINLLSGDDARSDAPATSDELERLVSLGIVDERIAPAPDSAVSGNETDTWTPYELAVQRMTNTGWAREHSASRQPPPLYEASTHGERTPLPAPVPLPATAIAEILTRRRTRRRYGERPLRLDELSTFLHHAARIARTGHDDRLGDYALRPFAGAGARSELEIYLVANAIEGLRPGAHHFDPLAHDLRVVRERDAHHERLVRWVHAAAGGQLDRDPPAILLITAVFARVMWKYRDLGLSLIYKDTGCLMQTLYLVATAMDLAPCAIGGGEELLNSRWLGLDPLVESQVGCFLLGPRAGDR